MNVFHHKTALLVLAAVIVGACVMFGASPDFTAMPEAKLKAAIKRLDSQILRVELEAYNDRDVPIIDFRTTPARYRSEANELFTDMEDIKDLARHVVTAKGSERFAGLTVVLNVPDDQYTGELVDIPVLSLHWRMETLSAMDWKTIRGWRFLELYDSQVAEHPLAGRLIGAYCYLDHGYNAGYCKKIEERSGPR